MDVVLDVGRVTGDASGIRGFTYPVSREEIVAMRDASLPLLVAGARVSGGSWNEDAELLSIVILHFLGEAMGLYQAHALVRRLVSAGHCPVVPARTRLLSAMAQSSPPVGYPFCDTLRAGPARLDLDLALPLPDALSDLWRSMRVVGLSFDSLRPFDPARDTFAVQWSPLISAHARSVGGRIRYLPVSHWFKPVDERRTSGSDRPSIASALLDCAVDAVRAGFASGDEALPPYLADYLRTWLAEATGLVRFHYRDVLRSRLMPRSLWTGSGGRIWQRILRHAARRSGGIVTGHDHAMGVGHLRYNVKMLNDFESCDVFVTFNAYQASGLREGIRSDLLVPSTPPSIISVPVRRDQGGDMDAGKLTGIRPSSRAVRRIMYPSSFYTGERVLYAVNIPDIISLDWELRLFGHLNSWGYQVLHKPHPGSVSLPSTELIKSLGAAILTDPFEKVMHLADAFIFITPQSMPFLSAMGTDKPVVFVDLGLFQWMPDAYEMLGQRCAIVRGSFDSANRVQVDWDELRDSILKSRDLSDMTLYRNYFHGCGERVTGTIA